MKTAWWIARSHNAHKATKRAKRAATLAFLRAAMVRQLAH